MQKQLFGDSFSYKKPLTKDEVQKSRVFLAISFRVLNLTLKL